MPYLSGRNFAFFLTVADFWRVRSYAPGIWYVLITNGLALIFICFADKIDDLTFGESAQGIGTPGIDVHTPPFLIALFGWVMLLLNTAMLFFTGWIGPVGGN